MPSAADAAAPAGSARTEAGPARAQTAPLRVAPPAAPAVTPADLRAEQLVRRWCKRLGLRDWRIDLVRISIWSVSDARCRVGNSFVGVVCDRPRRTAEILHTRRLDRESIVHELLHVRHPAWTEARVNAETDRLLGRGTGPSRGRARGRGDGTRRRRREAPWRR